MFSETDLHQLVLEKKKNTAPSKIFYQDVAKLQGNVGFGVKSY